MLNKFKQLVVQEEGQGMTEYGLILGLIAVVVIGALSLLGGEVKGIFNDIVLKFNPEAKVD
ncbi:Flp family type IVb pilin [Anaerobacillus alkaliphilus]|uniref:Flp family type IVb pilin n=1 Tax=Anaerobacillus alkaliphilus TaxID=1548597 RepID=A0A4Q0VU88_9BACI|nr:Flp family type IVb pilin [Anaerobacillus alkaliphilus]RXJ01902.1 Flp family type IVb pilin [Anaerobacillus alkaliphilus]